MISLDDIAIYLPKYLSPDSEKELFAELRNFPNNIDKRMYTRALTYEQSIFQGDGIAHLPLGLASPSAPTHTCMVFSNTCDIDINNERLFPSSICYAPIFSLREYEKAIQRESGKGESAIRDHIQAIKAQEITQIFFLPRQGVLEDDGIVFLDRIYNSPSATINCAEIPRKRLFSLSHFGHYLFLLKLSIHFTRITENIDRFSMSS